LIIIFIKINFIYAYMMRDAGAFARMDKLEAKILIYEWGVL